MTKRLVCAGLMLLMFLGMQSMHSKIITLQGQFNILDWQVNDRLIYIADKMKESTVFIHGQDCYGDWSGSGVIIGKHTIVTARHVVKDANSIVITDYAGVNIPVKNWIYDPNNDCAIITCDANLYSIVRPAKTATVGEHVFIIGSPYGKEFFNTVTYGIISGLERQDDYFGVNPVLTVDAAANPGNSGGPVFNMKGELIGIVVGGIRGADGFGVVITNTTIKAFLNGKS